MTLQERLQGLFDSLKKHGVSMRAVARDLDIDVSTLSHYLHGRREISSNFLDRIAESELIQKTLNWNEVETLCTLHLWWVESKTNSSLENIKASISRINI
jgi:transcriptional regulator with XRE-family HTH domain